MTAQFDGTRFREARDIARIVQPLEQYQVLPVNHQISARYARMMIDELLTNGSAELSNTVHTVQDIGHTWVLVEYCTVKDLRYAMHRLGGAPGTLTFVLVDYRHEQP